MVSGVFAGELELLEGSFQGRYRGQVGTDTSNALDGRQRGGGAILTYEPPTSAPPAGALDPAAVVKAMAFPFPTLTNGSPTWDQADLVILEKDQAPDRVVVGSRDLTDWRRTEPDHQPTAVPGYELTDPFGYGPSDDLFVPRIAGYFEEPGVGELSWAKPGASVFYQRRTEDGIATDYRGVVVGIKPQADGLLLSVAGDLSGRLAALLRPAPPARKVKDVGAWAANTMAKVHKHLTPRLGPVTGIKIPDAGGSGMTEESWAANICVMSQTRAGARRTMMPKTWGKDLWEFRVRDLETVHYTSYAEGDWTTVDVFDDALEQPNTWFASGISPDGTRWRGTEFTGYIQGDPAPYPMEGGDPFGIGTTDAATIHGDGIFVLWQKLRATGAMPPDTPYAGLYTSAFADAVADIQHKAGLAATGTMTTATWAALFDLDVTGYYRGSRVAPLVQDPKVAAFLYSNSGEIIGRNPAYDRTVLPVHRMIEFDSGVTKAMARNWIRGEQARTGAKNYVGNITLKQVGVWAGQHDDTDLDTLTVDDIVAGTEIRPETNIWLPYFDGGTLFHISRVKVSKDRQTVTLTVDTQGRDFLELKALIDRNREARRNPRRAWLAQNQPGRQSGNLVIRDEHFGYLPEDKALDPNTWNTFPLVIGQMGTIGQLLATTVNRQAQFCIAFFTHRVWRHQLNALVGSPFDVDDNKQTAFEHTHLDPFFNNRGILYLAGAGKQPCGYGWKKGYITNDAGVLVRSANPLTGSHLDHSSWSYLANAADDPVIWVAVWPDRATTMKAGQMLWAQEDDPT